MILRKSQSFKQYRYLVLNLIHHSSIHMPTQNDAMNKHDWFRPNKKNNMIAYKPVHNIDSSSNLTKKIVHLLVNLVLLCILLIKEKMMSCGWRRHDKSSLSLMVSLVTSLSQSLCLVLIFQIWRLLHPFLLLLELFQLFPLLICVPFPFLQLLLFQLQR